MRREPTDGHRDFRLRACPPSHIMLLLVAAVLAGCGRSLPDRAQQPEPGTGDKPAVLAGDDVPQKTVQALSDFNRGSALMEQYKYAEAAEAFESVLEAMPAWTAARFNLGLAYLNMQGSKSADESLEIAQQAFQQVLEADPGNLHALFCLGLYYQHLGDNPQALVYFGRVYVGDPEDRYVGFEYAESLLTAGEEAEGIRVLEKVVERDPGFVSAVYRLALQYRRSKGIDAAKPLLDRFQQLTAAELAGGSFAVQKVYGTVGKYYQVLGADGHPLVRQGVASARRVVFSPEISELAATPRPWNHNGESIRLPGLAVADVDRDGDLDLFVTATSQDGGGSIWLNDGSGSFQPAPGVPQPCVSASFGDVDNDGDDDLFLGCAEADVLLENTGRGTFLPSGFAHGSHAGSLTILSRLMDIDSDGDLDLLAFRLSAGSVPAGAEGTAAASSVFNNNRDGSYADIAQELDLQLADTPLAAVVCDDLDDDRDLDMVLFPVGPRDAILWMNDRLGAFRILAAGEAGLACDGVISATTGDPDKDGDRDLLVCTATALHLFENVGRCRFRLHQDFARRHGSLRATGGQFVDMDNDGDLDLLLADAYRRDGSRGPMLLVNSTGRGEFVDAAELDPSDLLSAIDTGGDASCVAADFTGNGCCDVLIASMNHPVQLIKNVTPGGHWITLDLQGSQGRDQMTRSNSSAVGARVEIKTGNVFQQCVVGGTSGPVAAAPLRVHAGLDDYPKVDWLRVVWPDGVIQAELEVAGDRVTAIKELSRKTSSCPYLFAWDGQRFQFVADFGGVGGLGYLVAPGAYAPPDPTEYVPVPNLAPRDGHYVLQALTVLEEVTYFDEARLIAVDHPLGTQVLPNEMMAISVPPPEFEVFCFDQPLDPVRARDHRGVDVTDELTQVDRRYAGATHRDMRFAGIAAPHFVELDFGDQLTQLRPDDRLVLVAHGWVEYGYSSTNYAAAQAGLRTEAPSIAVWRDGQWVELFHEVGYPAGTQHVMTLDVTGRIGPADRVLRISSNMDLYWDRICLAILKQDARVMISEVAATNADLHYFGFPREYSPDGRHPNLSDYENVDPSVAWKLMSGDYTRYGEVGDLVREADDCFVIMGRGEELTLKFSADAFAPVPQGYCRSFLLKTDSYCKDMDLHTAYPDSVEPLPFHTMSGYPYPAEEQYPDDAKHAQYRREFNTRRVRVQR